MQMNIVVMCDSTKSLEHFTKMFTRIIEDFGLNLNVQKTCTKIMALQQLEKPIQSSKTKGRNNITSLNIAIRDQKIETADSLNYLGCYVANDQTQSKEIEIRLGSASNALNSRRRVVRYRKCVSLQSKVRLFKACILPVLLYGSESWCLKAIEEQRLNTFYMKCLRILLRTCLGDRMRNDLILQTDWSTRIGKNSEKK